MTAGASGRVLVTGGLGYLGSRVIRDVGASCGFAHVRVLDNLQRADVYHALADLPAQVDVELLQGDILDPAAVRLAMQDVNAVVHLAGIARTPYSFDHPQWTEQVNHWGTARLVEHCIEAGVRRFVLASTASVYGSGGPFDEAATPRPLGPYAHAKLAAESHVGAAMAGKLDATILRLGILYGWAPSIRFDAAPNRMAWLAALGRPLNINGDGEQLRPLIHVADASNAICFSLSTAAETSGAVLNAASENVSVRDLVETLRGLRPDAEVRFTDQDVLTRITTAVSSARLKGMGWRPRHTLSDGLSEVIEHFHGASAYRFSPVPAEP